MEQTRCPFCGEKVYLGLDRCPYCAEHLPDNLQPINEAEENNHSQSQQYSDPQQNQSNGGYLWQQVAAEKQQQNQYQGQSQYQYQNQYQEQSQYQNPGPQPYGYPQGYQVPPYVPKMPFGKAIRTCLIDKYTTFSGRARRSEFWWFYLAQTILTYLLSRAARMTTNIEVADSGGEFFGIVWSSMASVLKNPVWWLSVIVWLGLLIPNLAAISRRLHDIGKSGWYQVIPFAAAALLYASVFTVSKSMGLWFLVPICVVLMLGACIFLLVWLCKDSDPYPNKWGPSPKYDQNFLEN